MANLQYSDDQEIGYLRFRHLNSEHADTNRPIYPNEGFDVGRRTFQNIWDLTEPTVSTHHLRFRCVVYEDDDELQVAPMVYLRVLSSNCVALTRVQIDSKDHRIVSKDDGDVLLDHEDRVQVTPTIFLDYEAAECYAVHSEGLDSIQRAEISRFRRQFHITDRRLGVGGQASVFVAISLRDKRQKACKIIPPPKEDYDALKQLPYDSTRSKQENREVLHLIEAKLMKKRKEMAREYNILQTLDHPNIISLEKVFCASYNIYIFQELITGGDLLSYIEREGALSEAQCAVIVRQLLKAVEHLHRNGIVHRDIKPENIMMTSWRDGARIVLTDFGQARTNEDAKTVVRSNAVFRMQSLVGTRGYAAPEVYQQLNREVRGKGYSKAIDIWSIGCITALLLTNELIFDPPHDEEGFPLPEVFGVEGGPSWWDLSIIDSDERFATAGRKVKSFIRDCLTHDDDWRLTAKQALLHPWFTNKHYATEIEAAYQRAIQDWKPRPQGGKMIEFIHTKDAFHVNSTSAHIERLIDEVKSRYFEDSVPPTSAAFPRPITSFRHSAADHVELANSPTQHETIEVPESPDMTQQTGVFASPVHASHYPELLDQARMDNAEDFSINDYRPPWTQPYPLPPSFVSSYGLTDSAPDSQRMLDEPTQTQYAASLELS